MTFKKVVKSKAYFKRFQVKYRRRRTGQTDYYARRRLIFQEKKKYNTPKYRLVVRRTNRDIIAQVVYSRMNGDYVMASAYGHELKDYGIKAGFNNYAACYATGLLLARRLLTSLNLADQYKGKEQIDGNDYTVDDEDVEGPQPFRCFLDVGLAPTTTGSRVFAVMKGAVDGGLSVPHNNKRFPGYDKEMKKLDVDTHRRYIFGQHVADYMHELADGTEDSEGEQIEAQPEKYQSHFAKYIAAGISHDGMEEMYTNAHAAIRADPARKQKEKKDVEKVRYGRVRMSLAQRKDRVRQKKESFLRKLEAQEAEE